MHNSKNMQMPFKLIFSVCFLLCFSVAHAGENPTTKKVSSGDTLKTPSLGAPLNKDEAIKCTRAELLSKEFSVIGDKNYPELLRITFQDLERGSREIIFQKKIVENDEVKFSFPHALVKETAMAVLIIMKGEGMFYKKIDIVD
ncbi:MAG: hypothetical protein KBG47_13425 [Bacteroidia bacterium]|nr:hypothetical protein [Sphingobacteriaceae bacterium]MBK7816631.1 hypothetical protein [Sphingobacteriaceae bacterium]MBP9070506.1 hypothetical protein [Bacteroidia bacterium]